jgi:hypothetical protein
MESVQEPQRCARGVKCLGYDPDKATSARLSRDNTDGICSQCRRKGSEVTQVLTAPAPVNKGTACNSYQILETDAGREIKKLKHELVLQLYYQNGPFWEAVREVRERWDIEPFTSHPTHAVESEVLPEGMPSQPPPPSSGDEYKEWFGTYKSWIKDLEKIAREAIQPTYIGEKFRPDWGSFISVCVLYQPSVSGDASEPKLLEFADIGGPWMESLPLKPDKDYPGGPLMAEKAPIRVMGDPAEEVRVENRCHNAVLQAVWELYLKPLGVTLDGILAEDHKAYPEIEQERSEGLSHNKDTQTYWIKVDNDVRVKDIENHYLSMITESQEERPGKDGPRVSRLECVECAVLARHHNWSQDQLMRRYSYPSESTLERRIKDGAKILKNS